MPTYLYRIQPVRPVMLSEGPTEDETRITSEHFEYLQNQMKRGTLILAGRTLNDDYSSFGIAIFNAHDDAHMRQLTAEDPGVSKGLFRAEWYPFRIALHERENASDQ